MSVQIVPFNKIRPFILRAYKDRITFNNPSNAIWWSNGKGFVCAVIGKRTIRFKSDWIIPEFRKQGYYRELFDTRFNYCMNINKSRITAFCLPSSLSIYLKYGFKCINQRRDITFVEWYKDDFDGRILL